MKECIMKLLEENKDDNINFKKTIYILSSNKCNNDCIFCTDYSYKNKKKYSPVKSIPEKYSQHRIVFTASEPTMNNNLINLIKEAKIRNYKDIVIITNGRMLSNKNYCEKLIKSGVTEFIVSIHGATPQTHDLITGMKGSWEETICGLNNILLFSKIYTYLHISINVTVTSLNLSEINRIKNFAISLNKIKTIVFHGLKPQGKALLKWNKIAVKYTDIMNNLCRDNIWTPQVRVCDIPLCVSAKYISEKNCEFYYNDRKVLKDNKLKKHNPKDTGKIFLKKCNKCIKSKICGGIYIKYLKTFGGKEFNAIR